MGVFQRFFTRMSTISLNVVAFSYETTPDAATSSIDTHNTHSLFM